MKKNLLAFICYITLLVLLYLAGYVKGRVTGEISAHKMWCSAFKLSYEKVITKGENHGQ